MKMHLLNYTISVLEYGTCFFFLNSLLFKRFSNCLPIVLATLSGAAVMFFCMELNMTIRAIIGLGIIFAGSLVLFSDKPFIKLSYSVLLLFFISIIEVLFGSLFAIFFDKEFVEVFYSDFIYRMVSCFTIKGVDIAILILIQRSFRKINYDLNPKYWGALGTVFGILLFATVTSLNFYSRIPQDKSVILFFLVISISLFSISLIVVYFFPLSARAFNEKKRCTYLNQVIKYLRMRLPCRTAIPKI